MGNADSNASIKAMHTNYVVVRNMKDDARYGEGRIVKQKQTKQELFQKEINLTDEEKYQTLKILLEKKECNTYDNLINITKLFYHEENQFCGQFFKIFILMEYIPTTLCDILEQRLAKKQEFQESELWTILIGCIEGCCILESQKITHQGLRLDSISYLDQFPYVKILDPTLSGVPTTYQQLIQDETKQINLNYLSPKLIQSLNDDMQPQHNPYKSDVYSLGMIMLHLSSAHNCEDCYDLQKMRVNHQQVQRRLLILESTFSSQYIQVLRTMLLLNEDQRPDFLELRSEMQSMSPPASPKAHIQEQEEEVIQSKKTQIVQVQAYEQAVESFAIPQQQYQLQASQPPQIFVNPEQSAKFIQQQQNSVHNSQVQVQRSIQLRQSQQSVQSNQSMYIQRNGLKDLRPDICDHLKIVLPLSEQPPEPSQVDTNIGNQIGTEELLNRSNIQQHDILMPITSFSNSRQYEQFLQSKSNMPVSYESYKMESSFKNQQNAEPVSKYDYLYDKQMSNQQKFSNYQSDLKRTLESKRVETVSESYPNGSRYEGQKLNGMRHGQGTFFYQDNGGVYEGQWFENKMHGQGSTLFYASGKPAYEGEWLNDKFQGSGTLYNEEPQALYGDFDYGDFDRIGDYWTRYIGQFNQDNKEGQGTLYLSNGDRFEGNFLQDLINGPGRYIKKNGQIISAKWWRNKLQQ
ncbi:unnamed protein product (macronuclear) [Paramecium tetraurelia]|uniref:Protein kinase domain-containing protein n=1 Tax=Paramecium tetraurelia TaxID=5888 RepID=A0CR70_PARTE|nr:uncharacterized protein GSPATT00009602001 [Paramecium tetraurelia]CAK73287.1 unnamed protein product [Paramecium tetraurelia]|eukprot:XP_001440684.1 hypothetical protein (macronuclear) [Paramecium tetraurelia strain d4-2]